MATFEMIRLYGATLYSWESIRHYTAETTGGWVIAAVEIARSYWGGASRGSDVVDAAGAVSRGGLLGLYARSGALTAVVDRVSPNRQFLSAKHKKGELTITR